MQGEEEPSSDQQKEVPLEDIASSEAEGEQRKGFSLRYSPSGPIPTELPDESPEGGNDNDNTGTDGEKVMKKKKKKKKGENDKVKKNKGKKKKKEADVEVGDDDQEEEPDEDAEDAPDEKSIPVTDKFVLRSYNDTPFYLRSNKFIREGYRVNFTLRLCCTSMCRMHNETWNIWTHHIGFLSFVILAALTFGLWLQLVATPRYDDYLIFAVFLFCAMGQMLFSALFHQFCCRSSGVYRWGARLDYSGA